MNLSNDFFYQKALTIIVKMAKKNWVSAFWSCVNWTGVNIITYGKLSGVPLNILSSVVGILGHLFQRKHELQLLLVWFSILKRLPSLWMRMVDRKQVKGNFI